MFLNTNTFDVLFLKTFFSKWGNLSIRQNIEVVVDVGESRGSGPFHTPPLSIIPRAVVEEVVVPESEKDGRVRGGRCGKHSEFRKLVEVLTGRRLG